MDVSVSLTPDELNLENRLPDHGLEPPAFQAKQKRGRGRPRKEPKVLTESNPDRPRPHTRSKNGCKTCRKRKKKCDELKPVCGICTANGLQCGWNPLISSTRRASTSSSSVGTAISSPPTSTSPDPTDLIYHSDAVSMESPSVALDAGGEMSEKRALLDHFDQYVAPLVFSHSTEEFYMCREFSKMARRTLPCMDGLRSAVLACSAAALIPSDPMRYANRCQNYATAAHDWFRQVDSAALRQSKSDLAPELAAVGNIVLACMRHAICGDAAGEHRFHLASVHSLLHMLPQTRLTNACRYFLGYHLTVERLLRRTDALDLARGVNWQNQPDSPSNKHQRPSPRVMHLLERISLLRSSQSLSSQDLTCFQLELSNVFHVLTNDFDRLYSSCCQLVFYCTASQGSDAFHLSSELENAIQALHNLLDLQERQYLVAPIIILYGICNNEVQRRRLREEAQRLGQYRGLYNLRRIERLMSIMPDSTQDNPGFDSEWEQRLAPGSADDMILL